MLSPFVGRERELVTLHALLAQVETGRGQVVGVVGEAGMGKSRLVSEFARTATLRGNIVAVGECQSYGTNTSYFVWREIWSRPSFSTPRQGVASACASRPATSA